MDLPPIIQPTAQPRSGPIWEKAKDVEASFLAEMLKHSGLGDVSSQFGGGVGEDQFSSFLIREQARVMTDAGGIGIAEIIFDSLAKDNT